MLLRRHLLTTSAPARADVATARLGARRAIGRRRRHPDGLATAGVGAGRRIDGADGIDHDASPPSETPIS